MAFCFADFFLVFFLADVSTLFNTRCADGGRAIAMLSGVSAVVDVLEDVGTAAVGMGKGCE